LHFFFQVYNIRRGRRRGVVQPRVRGRDEEQVETRPREAEGHRHRQPPLGPRKMRADHAASGRANTRNCSTLNINNNNNNNNSKHNEKQKIIKTRQQKQYDNKNNTTTKTIRQQKQ